MLFRSDFLKRGVIPDHIERRQQTLSRVAGQVWNLMAKEEQQIWFDRAAQVLNEHRRKNPNYKFTPAPRNSRRGKSKLCDDSPGVSEAEVQRLREEYAQVLGPAPPSNRKRRVKKARSVEAAERVHPAPFPTSSFPAIPSLATPDYVRDIGQSPPLISFYPMESFPKPTIPRRPSTSLGFNECAKEGSVPPSDFNLFQAEFGRTASEWNVASSKRGTSPLTQYVRTTVSPFCRYGDNFRLFISFFSTDFIITDSVRKHPSRTSSFSACTALIPSPGKHRRRVSRPLFGQRWDFPNSALREFDVPRVWRLHELLPKPRHGRPQLLGFSTWSIFYFQFSA